MDIAAISMNFNQMKVAQQTSVLVMKMAMETAKVQSTDLAELLAACTKTMEQSVNPQLGTNIDVRG